MDNEIAKQTVIGLFKGGVGAIPFGGTLINEILFDIRARVKSERLLSFVEHLLNDMKKKGITIKLEEKKDSDVFTDYLEEILKIISQKNQSEKHSYFSKLIEDSLISDDFDFSKHSIFSEILSKVSNEEILLLADHYKSIIKQSTEQGKDPETNFRFIPLHLNNAYSRTREEAIAGTPIIWDHNKAVLADHLIQIGLMTDCSFVSMDADARERVCLTDLGYEFIKYISADHYSD